MVLQEETRQLEDCSIEIIATDLNERCLAYARDAIYGTHSIRYLTSYYREKYFVPVGDKLQLIPLVRNLVRFTRLNLSDHAQMALMNDVDLILCCNVLIYFDIDSKRHVIERLYNSLLPQGYLFLGQTESLYGVNDQFRLIHFPGATAYGRADLS